MYLTCIYIVHNDKPKNPFQVRVHPTQYNKHDVPKYYPDLPKLKTLDDTNLSIPQVSELGVADTKENCHDLDWVNYQ